jgi:hypothetical protein
MLVQHQPARHGWSHGRRFRRHGLRHDDEYARNDRLDRDAGWE